MTYGWKNWWKATKNPFVVMAPIGARYVDMMFYTSIHISLALFRWPSLILNPSMYGIFDTSKSALPKVRADMKKTMCCE